MMIKLVRKAALATLAVALFAAAPVASSAAPPAPGACHTLTDGNFSPPSGSQVNPPAVPGTGSQAWAYANQAGESQAGIKGSNGFLVVKANQNGTNPYVNVTGRLNAVDLRGTASVTPNAATKAQLCLSQGGQKIVIKLPG